MTDGTPVLEARAITKTYRRPTAGGGEAIPVLTDLELTVGSRESLAIRGDSGIGKTTLLNILGGLDRPDRGEVLHHGAPIPVGPAERARWRRRSVGFIFQFHGLLTEFTALENVALAGIILGRSRKDSLRDASNLLEALGLSDRGGHFPAQLSGGEQQRVAVARALITGPSLVIADEPTGNLDPRTGDQVLDCLFERQAVHGFSLVVATHSERVASRCHRVLRVVGGRLVPCTASAGDPPLVAPAEERPPEPT